MLIEYCCFSGETASMDNCFFGMRCCNLCHHYCQCTIYNCKTALVGRSKELGYTVGWQYRLFPAEGVIDLKKEETQESSLCVLLLYNSSLFI